MLQSETKTYGEIRNQTIQNHIITTQIKMSMPYKEMEMVGELTNF